MPRSSKGPKRDCFLCGKDAKHRCENCKLVSYCSKDHYLSHRQRGYCFPFKIDWKQVGGGHCMVAARDIKPLELVFFEWNLVTGPSVTSETNDLKQKAAMAVSLLQSRKANSKVHTRTQFHLQNRVGRQTFDESNEDTEKWRQSKKQLAEFLLNECGFADCVEEEEVDWILELTRRSAIPSPESKTSSVIFPTLSLMSHSCVPNCKFVVYPNGTVAVLTQTAVAAGDELTVSLVPALEPTWKRRAKLMRDYLLSCSCRRCRDPKELGTFLSALKCNLCQGDDIGAVLPDDPLNPKSNWRCEKHPDKTVFTSEQATSLSLDVQRRLYSEGPFTTLPELEAALNKFSKVLHPQHGLIMMLKRSLLVCHTQMPAESVGRKELERMKKLGLEQLSVLAKVDPGYPDWRGDVLRHYSTAELNLAKLDLEEGLMERPAFMLRVRKAMIFVQEGLRCTSCVRIDRTLHTQMSINHLGEEMSADSSYWSDASCSGTYFD